MKMTKAKPSESSNPNVNPRYKTEIQLMTWQFPGIIGILKKSKRRERERERRCLHLQKVCTFEGARPENSTPFPNPIIPSQKTPVISTTNISVSGRYRALFLALD